MQYCVFIGGKNYMLQKTVQKTWHNLFFTTVSSCSLISSCLKPWSMFFFFIPSTNLLERTVMILNIQSFIYISTPSFHSLSHLSHSSLDFLNLKNLFNLQITKSRLYGNISHWSKRWWLWTSQIQSSLYCHCWPKESFYRSISSPVPGQINHSCQRWHWLQNGGI